MRLAPIEMLYLLLPWALLAWVLFGNRPRVERFVAVNDLPRRPTDLERIRSVLRRTYRARVVGGLLGFLTGSVVGARVSHPQMVAGGGIGLLLGTMLGIALAQLRRRRTPAGTRSASLRIRDAADYRPPAATAVTLAVSLLVAGYGVLVVASAPQGTDTARLPLAVGAATLLAVPLGRWLQRRTVEMQRVDADETAIRVDDALRAAAVRGVHHATLGVLCCGLLLTGYVGTTTQNVIEVRDGDRVLLREPALTMTAVPPRSVDPVSDRRVTWRVTWTAPDGSEHERRVHGTRAGTLVAGTWGFGPVAWIGFWAVLVGLVGACFEWGRAAKAWRRPQRIPSPPPDAVTVGVG